MILNLTHSSFNVLSRLNITLVHFLLFRAFPRPKPDARDVANRRYVSTLIHFWQCMDYWLCFFRSHITVYDLSRYKDTNMYGNQISQGLVAIEVTRIQYST